MRYEKIITVNDFQNRNTVIHSAQILLHFMFDNCSAPEYFRLRLKDSENSIFAKDLLLEWCDLKEEKKDETNP